MNCSKSELHTELEKLKTIFLDNGYPEDVIFFYTKEKMARFFGCSKVFRSAKVPSLFETTMPWSRNTVKTSNSAIGQHLFDNPDCAKLYDDDMFWIIGRARSS